MSFADHLANLIYSPTFNPSRMSLATNDVTRHFRDNIVHFRVIDFVVPFDFAIYSSIKKNDSSFDLAIFLLNRTDTNSVIEVIY